MRRLIEFLIRPAIIVLVAMTIAIVVAPRAKAQLLLDVELDWGKDTELKNWAETFAAAGIIPYLLVYANGELIGLVPGTYAVDRAAPLFKKEILVEIGIPQLDRYPLYTFLLSTEKLEKKVIDVVQSGFGSDQTKLPKLGKDIIVLPSVSRSVEVRETAYDQYSLMLEATPYKNLVVYWRSIGVPARVEPEQDNSTATGVKHLVYDTTDQKIATLGDKSASSWSGGMTTVGLGLGYPVVDLLVRSRPEQANIYTHEGERGMTNLRIKDVKITSGFFVILKRYSFADCVKHERDITNFAGLKVISCDLISKRRQQ